MRVYQIAQNLQSDSRYVMRELAAVGVHVKSPSSQVEPILAAAFMAVQIRQKFAASIVDDDDEDFGELISYCPACGQPIDYCQGHGEIGDPVGFETLRLHDIDIHVRCHPNGCEERARHIHPDGVRNI